MPNSQGGGLGPAAVDPTHNADAPPDPTGWFSYRPFTEEVSWSDSLFGLFGFAAGEVVPTLSLMGSHQHPQDRTWWDAQLAKMQSVGFIGGGWHRIIDAQSRHRNVHTMLSTIADDDGLVVQINGLMTDVTARLERERAAAARAAVALAAQSRGGIDLAKGIIMASMNVGEGDAFDLLRWHSSHMNIKLRDVAAAVVQHGAALVEPDTASTGRERLMIAMSALAPAREPELPAARSRSDPAVSVDVAAETSRTSRIEPQDLPATLLRAVAAAGQSISIADYNAPDQPLVYVNRAFETLTGYGARDILGRNCRFLQEPTTTAESEIAAVAAVRKAIAAGQESRTVVRNYRRDGTPFWNELHLSAVRDAAGVVTHYIGYQTDVSERVERELQLEHLALHDARTNLPNQAAAAAHLQGLLTPGSSALDHAVLLIHLSGFRGAGHPDDPAAIAAVLAAAARRLQQAVDPGTYLAKLDDDTFLLAPADTRARDRVALALTDPLPLQHGGIQLDVDIDNITANRAATLIQTAAVNPRDVPATVPEEPGQSRR